MAAMEQPLAVRMRPRSLQEFVGQNDILGEKSWLRQSIAGGQLPSIIFFGPPGCGKTTLAEIIANESKSHFERMNATNASVGDIRKVAESAKMRLYGIMGERTILFIDEIHRFNKGQQDALLPFVESGLFVLIGATTENPYFEVNAPLLSRMRLVRLGSLSAADIAALLQRALLDEERGLRKKWQGNAGEGVLLSIADFAAGDARVALNILEQAIYCAIEKKQDELTMEAVEMVVGERVQYYDKSGDSHYDVASAFIKSMRGSDPDAVLHYLARMLEGGEDVRFIARRIIICAAEDVGNADAQALSVATSAMQAVHFVGMPEARIILAQAAVYVACAPKSNAAYLGIDRALNDVRKKNCGKVPAYLRDASYKGASKLGHGLTYKYPHDYQYGHVKQQYLPDEIKDAVYYTPTRYGQEKIISERLEFWKKQ